MMKQAASAESTASRVDLVRTVQTPLGFFVLVVLVVEAIFGVTASLSDGPARTYLVIGMLVVILLLIGIVAFLAYRRPEALRGERPSERTDDIDSLEGVEDIALPRVLCASTQTFEPLGFDGDIEILERSFGDRVTVVRQLTADKLREVLLTSRQQFDIVHLLSYVEPKGGSLELVPGEAEESISSDGFINMLKNCGARLVVLAVCDSIELAARVSRQTNILAATTSMESGAFQKWASCFYGLLKGGERLSRAHDYSRSTTSAPMVLLLKEDLTFGRDVGILTPFSRPRRLPFSR